jgi:hypothetical protein
MVGELRLEHLIGNVGTAQFEPGEGERREQRQQDDGEDFQVRLRARSGGSAPTLGGSDLKDIPFSLANGLTSRKKPHYHDLSCLRVRTFMSHLLQIDHNDRRHRDGPRSCP